MAEGSMWEALDKASYYRLDNLTAIVDVNRLGQRGPTELGWDLDAYARRVEAFGCHAIVVDGHDPAEIDKALAAAPGTGRPAVILARTRKGRGFSEVEDREGWHGQPLPAEMAERAIAELGGERHLTVTGPLPSRPAAPRARPAEDFLKAYPERYFEMYIAEQQLVAAAVGLSVRGYVPFAATFAAFFSRAYDFIRMAAISQASIRLAGSHAGTEIGADGPSQMALEDRAMMRAVHGSTVFYPADATSAAALVREMAGLAGVSYLRTTRGAYPVLYGPDEAFAAGGSKTVRSGPDDQVTLIGAGVTLHNCLAAADELAQGGIAARVIDLYSVKPVDTATLAAAAAVTSGRLIVAEDHYPEGGLGGAVLEALSDAGHPARITHLAVRSLPGSGTPAELMEAAGISAARIAQAARDTLR
jgi:transketolase